MNTMINPEPQPSREDLLTKIELLEAEVNGLKTTLQVCDEHLKSYRQQKDNVKESVESLVHKHLDLEGTEFYETIVELFDIELTKTVTVQYTVSVEVQATVPVTMTTSEVEEELQSAKLDYEFLGSSDIEIESFGFGYLEVE